MTRLRNIIPTRKPNLKTTGACLLLMTAIGIHATGCSQHKSPSSGKPETAAKPKKFIRQPSATGEFDNDAYAVYGRGSSLHRNFPLAGTKWEWEGKLNPDGFDSLGNSSSYRLEFQPDGWFDFHADCRNGSGIYEITGDRIALAVMKTSHSTCQRHLEAEGFEHAIEEARIYRMDDGKLYFESKHEDKTLIFHLSP